jgi:hypothetical protein
MRPISEIDIEAVSAAERRAYRVFIRDYDQLGQTYIDPIAVAVDRGDGETSFDLRVTPLHDRSEYRELKELVGDVHLYEGASAPGVQWRFGIGEESDLRKWTERSADRTIRGRDIAFSWLGTWGAMGFSDRSGVWDAANLYGVLPSRGRGPDRLFAYLFRSLEDVNRMPFWLALEVESSMGFATFMGGIRSFGEESGPNLVSWRSAESYRELDVTAIDFQDLQSDSSSATAYYTVAEGVFILSMDRTTLEHRIDALKAGYNPRPSPALRDASGKRDDETNNPDGEREASADGASSENVPTPRGPQSALEFRRAAGKSWLLQTLHGLVELGSNLRLPGVAAARTAAERCWPHLDGDALRHRAAEWGNLSMDNPHGREVDYRDGAVEDPVYGLLPFTIDLHPGTDLQKLPELPVEPSPITDWINSLSAARFEMSFERHGEALGLHTRTTFEWRETE